MSSLVVVERPSEPPARVEDIPAMEDEAAWCMQQHRVQHATTLVSGDGRDLVCIFAAPDAEAVRTVLRTLGAPWTHVWPGTVHAPPHLPPAAPLAARNGAALVVVERAFDAPTEVATVQAAEDAHAWCLEQHRVRFLRTYCAADRRRMLCLYDAPDAEAVRRAQQQAGLPFARAWGARLYEVSLR